MIGNVSLTNIHRIFEIPEIKLIRNDKILLIDSKGNFLNRHLLITSTGIFILKEKIFPYGFKTVYIISYFDFKKIILKNDKAEFLFLNF